MGRQVVEDDDVSGAEGGREEGLGIGGEGRASRIEALDREFIACARSSAPARRLATIPGIGALNATAMVAAVGEAEGFAHGRDLVPRQMTTGGKARLGGITKRGNSYLRTLLIHGARAALPGLSRSDTPLGPGCAA